MTGHRAQCRSVPPTTPTVNGVYHRHYCIHDATLPFGTVLEHECRCGMTWTEPEFEITFHPDVTAAEIAEFVRVRQRGEVSAEPIPAFAECGRPGCDLREKRLEHGHGGHSRYFRLPKRSLWQRLTRWFR